MTKNIIGPQLRSLILHTQLMSRKELWKAQESHGLQYVQLVLHFCTHHSFLWTHFISSMKTAWCTSGIHGYNSVLEVRRPLPCAHLPHLPHPLPHALPHLHTPFPLYPFPIFPLLLKDFFGIFSLSPIDFAWLELTLTGFHIPSNWNAIFVVCFH